MYLGRQWQCYPYTAQLEEMDRRRPGPECSDISEWLRGIRSPLMPGGHPDASYRDYLLEGLEQGFRIGFKHMNCTCRGAEANMPSAWKNREVVDQYLENEVQQGRVLGPVDSCKVPVRVVINRFGVIPKPHQPGKWRLIVDLSHPRGESVNDGIERELCSLTYPSVDQAIRSIRHQGLGAELAKFDVESAYRLIPVHPEDRPLLGMQWRGKSLHSHLA